MCFVSSIRLICAWFCRLWMSISYCSICEGYLASDVLLDLFACAWPDSLMLAMLYLTQIRSWVVSCRLHVLCVVVIFRMSYEYLCIHVAVIWMLTCVYCNILFSLSCFIYLDRLLALSTVRVVCYVYLFVSMLQLINWLCTLIRRPVI
jgi:heme/copper-type cytochrome/quinol oxidase subunit 4